MEEKTKLKGIRAGDRGLSFDAEVTETGEIRAFEKFGKPGQLQEVTLSDGTGTAVLVLWNEQAGTLSSGDKVKVTGAYTKEFRGNIQLHVSRQGSIEKQ